MNKFCTDKIRNTCNGEKLGCDGCYYSIEEYLLKFLNSFMNEDLKQILSMNGSSDYLNNVQQAIACLVSKYEEIRQATQINKNLYEAKCNELKEKDLDLTTVYINGYEEGKTIYKQKIKDKIDDLTRLNVNLTVRHMRQAQIKVLQELLEDNKKGE